MTANKETTVRAIMGSHATTATAAPWIVTLRKEYSTWYWFTENPAGGGFGSSNCGPKRTALAQALRGIPSGTPYKLVTNGLESHGVQP